MGYLRSTSHLLGQQDKKDSITVGRQVKKSSCELRNVVWALFVFACGVGGGGGSRDRTRRPTVGYSVSGFHMRLEGHGREGIPRWRTHFPQAHVNSDSQHSLHSWGWEWGGSGGGQSGKWIRKLLEQEGELFQRHASPFLAGNHWQHHLTLSNGSALELENHLGNIIYVSTIEHLPLITTILNPLKRQHSFSTISEI